MIPILNGVGKAQLGGGPNVAHRHDDDDELRLLVLHTTILLKPCIWLLFSTVVEMEEVEGDIMMGLTTGGKSKNPASLDTAERVW